MKVNSNPTAPRLERVGTSATETEAASKQNHSAPRAASEGARVAVSSVAKRLAAAKAPETPDKAKIDQLRDMLQSGKLKIDSKKIADAILREERA